MKAQGGWRGALDDLLKLSCQTYIWTQIEWLLIGKGPDAGKDCRQKEKLVAEDEMVR